MHNTIEDMEQEKKNTGGRPKVEGDRHMYTIADDAHEWIMAHGGGQYITDIVRVIMAITEKGQR